MSDRIKVDPDGVSFQSGLLVPVGTAVSVVDGPVSPQCGFSGVLRGRAVWLGDGFGCEPSDLKHGRVVVYHRVDGLRYGRALVPVEVPPVEVPKVGAVRAVRAVCTEADPCESRAILGWTVRIDDTGGMFDTDKEVPSYLASIVFCPWCGGKVTE